MSLPVTKMELFHVTPLDSYIPHTCVCGPHTCVCGPHTSSDLSSSRRNRETGLNEETELEKHEGIFDYVEEDEYARIVQQRQEEGFILDDGKDTRCEVVYFNF